jgi:hypothetical protein
MASNGWRVSFRPRWRCQASDRWVADTGNFTSNTAKALVALNPEAADPDGGSVNPQATSTTDAIAGWKSGPLWRELKSRETD